MHSITLLEHTKTRKITKALLRRKLDTYQLKRDMLWHCICDKVSTTWIPRNYKYFDWFNPSISLIPRHL